MFSLPHASLKMGWRLSFLRLHDRVWEGGNERQVGGGGKKDDKREVVGVK